MRYWKFDVIGLLMDYKQNQNAVVSLQLMERDTKNEIKNPLVDTDRAMLERRLAQIRCKIQEHQTYCDLVVLGFDVIPEEQRRALELCYCEQLGINETALQMGVRAADLKKTVKQGLIDFAKVVSPL